jgi:PAS domain S-box-containing protein
MTSNLLRTLSRRRLATLALAVLAVGVPAALTAVLGAALGARGDPGPFAIYYLAVLVAAIYVILREVSRRKAYELEIERLNRLYSALSQINQGLVWMPTRDELFRGVCQVLVEHGGFRLAWIAWHDPQHQALVPVAQCGDTDGFLEAIRIHADDRPEGRGPSGTAFREGRSYICNDLLTDPSTLPWRTEVARRGFRASAALPIRVSGEPGGTLTVIASEPGFFKEQEIALLTEAAVSISFSLDSLAREEERRQAAEAAERERSFSTTIVESVPGILYLYDQQGRFLRWNRSLERVSGYSGVEIARMHPLDFFSAEERPLLAARIAEVFERGASSVEASLISRNGTHTPYFFTGTRIMFDGAVCLVGMGLDISEGKRTETALRESEQRFHAFMDATPAIAWMTDEAGRHLYMNRAWDDAFGLRREEWIGKTAYDLVPAEAAERIRQSDADLLRLDSALEIPDDAGVLRGKRFHWNCFKFPFRNAAGQRLIGGIAIDITERRLAEEAQGRLAEQEHLARIEAEKARWQLDHILESMTDAFVSLDHNWRYVYVNDRAARIFNRRREDLLGKHIWTEFPEGVGQPFQRLYERAMSEQVPIQFEEYYPPYERWFENRVYPTQGGISIVFQDITDRKRAETLLRESNESLEIKVAERTTELKAALVRAEAADRIKSAFLATMSHELRTPLNSILGFTGIVLQGLAGPLSAEQTKQLGMVRSSARHLLELIGDVLDISKIEAGQMDVRTESVDLHASVDRVTGTVKPMLEKKGLTLSVVMPPALEPIGSDRRRVEQILLNLLNNAIKFTDNGGITLTAERVSDLRQPPGAEPQSAVCIRVADTGIGIKEEDLATLFQPFRQIDRGLTRQHEGTGLGLAICRRLTELLGGAIGVESVWGRGSVFTVTIPLKTRTLRP